MSHANTVLNSAWLGKEFGQELATKWGYNLSELPKGKRGKWKGYIKANLHWEKATKGGWYNSILNTFNADDIGKKASNVVYPNEILWSCVVDQYSGEILGFKAHAKIFQDIELHVQRIYTTNHNKENRMYGYDDSVFRFDSIRSKLLVDEDSLTQCYKKWYDRTHG